MPDLKQALVYTKPNGLRPRWAIFPLREKAPAVSAEKDGHGCKDATADPERVAAWWKEYPDANIGLATGKVNGILVLDIDRNHAEGVDGEETLKDLERELGPLPPTVEALTPNGGRHLYFRYPVGRNIGSCAARPDRPGIDVRGNGGYVVAPPSMIKCADGQKRAYEWEVSSYPHETPLAELPEAWILWLAPRDKHFVLPDPDTVTKGTRHDTLLRYACSLRAKGSDEGSIAKAVKEYNGRLKEPLGEKEIAGIIDHAAKHEVSVGKKHKPPLTLPDFKQALADRNRQVRHDLITGRMEITARTPSGREMGADDLCTLMYSELCGSYSGCTPEIINRFIGYTARDNRFNPVLELLEATEWDGVDRFPRLFGIMGITFDPSSQVYTRKWMYQGIALQFNELEGAYGADGCLVLNGPQGAGKTSLLRHLALKDEWFGEGACIDDMDKDTSRRAVTTWITELGELESTLKKSDISKMKAFVTQTVDQYRLPYGKYDVREPRRTNLCATCNSDGYLIDTTGNRRWWTVPITKNIRREELLELNILQLWAQVYAIIAPMSRDERAACYRLTEEERKELDERNGRYEKPVKAQEEVADILYKAKLNNLEMRLMTVTEFKGYWDELRPFSVRQIGIALKANGVEVIRTAKERLLLLPVPGRGWMGYQ